MTNDYEPYRPNLHFTPRANWLNDPNGLIRVGDVYHMFFQYYPDGLTHGPMHWGHATSTNLVHWSELPIALYPDDLGQCYSGSAVAAAEGRVAPELAVAEDEILLFYTAHRTRVDVDAVQTQCLAVGNHDLTEFRRIAGNPIIANPGLEVFRDPKVIWHAPSQSWIMVITHGQSIGFYTSSDAGTWLFASEFGAEDGRHGDGPWECPDLLSIHDDNGETYWVLVVGIGDGHVTGGSGTQYFVGQFDGKHFVNGAAKSTELWMDWGRDYYAAQSFSALGDEAPLAIAWASNWHYARQTKTSAFRGAMSLPRRLSLLATDNGPRLRQQVDRIAAAAFADMTVDAVAGRQTVQPASGTYRLSVDWLVDTGKQVEISLFGEERPHFVISEKAGGHVLRVLRNKSGVEGSRGPFESDFEVPLNPGSAGQIEIFVDNGLVEAGFCNGTIWVTMLYFPSDTAGAVTISTTACWLPH